MIRALLHVWVYGETDEDVDRTINAFPDGLVVVEKHRYETED